MNINLQQIDELRNRANVGYAEAKDALERFNGNIVDALAYLEQNKKTKHGFKEASSDIIGTANSLLDKGSKTRVLVKKDGIVKIDVSANTAILFGIIGFHAAVLAGIIGLVTNHKLCIEKHTGEIIDVNNAVSSYSSNIATQYSDNK